MTKVTKPPLAVTATAEEPWVELGDGASHGAWDRDAEIVYNQTNRQAEKALFFQRTFDFLTENQIPGDYHEFGCHRGRTFRMALTEARRHNLERMKFFAFDSFEGLPEPKSDIFKEDWTAGAPATSEDEFLSVIQGHGIYADKVRTIKGFYQDSLTTELQVEFRDCEAKIALCAIDCTFYESAVPVFDFIAPLLQEGSVIFLDGLFSGYRGSPGKGVAKAFREFQKRTRWQFIRHLDVGWSGRSYIVCLEKDEIDGVL